MQRYMIDSLRMIIVFANNKKSDGTILQVGCAEICRQIQTKNLDGFFFLEHG